MNRLRLPAILTFALIAGCSDSPSRAGDRAADPVVQARGEAAGLKIVLGVDAVDVAKRRITLRGPQGRVGTYDVGPDVKRLAEIKAGDTILVEYRVSAVVDLREPTQQEAESPVVLAEMLDRKPSNQPPGATIARSVRLVAEIEALNGTAGTVTLKGPLDGQLHAKAEDASAVLKLKVGQKIVATFAETMTLSVDPGAPKK